MRHARPDQRMAVATVIAGIVALALAGTLAYVAAGRRSADERLLGANPTASPATGAPSATPGHSVGATRSSILDLPAVPRPDPKKITSWAYQLQGYDRDRLDTLAKAKQPLVVIDLARDASLDYFRADEIEVLHRAGKRVLAYFEIGTIEDFRPEYQALRQGAADLILNRWEDWPNEYFVRYWDERWWDRIIGPRVDQALSAGFDGVYLDTPLAYEELDLKLVPGQTRAILARQMVALIARISQYAKSQRSGFWIFPQNSPELRSYDGYVSAIDGIGMEELFFQATDKACKESFCAENLADTRALRAAGKLVLAVDYATTAANVKAACARYRTERFVGYVARLALERIDPPCAG